MEMATAVGQIGLIGIDSEGGDIAYFSLAQEAGTQNLTKVGDRPVWFYVDLRQNGPPAGRALLQKVYRAQSTGGMVIVSFDPSQPKTEKLVNCCFRAASIQLLPPAEAIGQHESDQEPMIAGGAQLKPDGGGRDMGRPAT
jgi:hypothetical protein